MKRVVAQHDRNIPRERAPKRRRGWSPAEASTLSGTPGNRWKQRRKEADHDEKEPTAVKTDVDGRSAGQRKDDTAHHTARDVQMPATAANDERSSGWIRWISGVSGWSAGRCDQQEERQEKERNRIPGEMRQAHALPLPASAAHDSGKRRWRTLLWRTEFRAPRGERKPYA